MRTLAGWGTPTLDSRGGATRRAVAVLTVLVVMALATVPTSALAPTADCSKTAVGLTPLTELTGATYLGELGGLYPEGSNTIPTSHLAVGMGLSTTIEPLSADGEPSGDGTIGIVTIGVSNTATQSNSWIGTAAGDPEIRPEVTIVNGAQSGQTISEWLPADGEPWSELQVRLDEAGLTAAQVQAAWVNLPMRLEVSVFPETFTTYRDDLAEVMRTLDSFFPNLEVAHLSSRMYGGYGSALSPEPVAYEHAFGTKWLIEAQVNQEAGFNPDPAVGPTDMPWVAWGPYLWADGITPRADGLIWECADFRADGIHPSSEGAAKVAAMLNAFYKSDPVTCSWFTTLECPVPAVPPSAVWLSPLAGSTVSGEVPLSIDVTEPVPGIEWRVDSGPWTPAANETDGISFSGLWDTATVPDGAYSLDARVTGAADITTVEVFVDNGSATMLEARLKVQCRGLICTADGSRSTGVGTLTYTWDLGDGTTGTGPSIEHEYAQAGTYIVVLTVMNAGATATAETSAEARSR